MTVPQRLRGAEPTCPKCGDDCTSRYWFALTAQMPACHILICLGCNHVWAVTPLDATNADDEPEDAYLAGKLAECDACASIPVSRIVAVLAERHAYHERETRQSTQMTHLGRRWECDSIAETLDIEDAYRAELARRKGMA